MELEPHVLEDATHSTLLFAKTETGWKKEKLEAFTAVRIQIEVDKRKAILY
jgi:hypothetical protein